MVDKQLANRGIAHPDVLSAMREIPRHLFVPPRVREEAYEDHPLSIGYGQTISQPYIVAYMSELVAENSPAGGKVLEIGSGCGYQTAVLVRMGYTVHSIDIVPQLVDQARSTLTELGLLPRSLECKDGYAGLEIHAPFDVVLSAACAEELPNKWVEQLSEGGVIISPVEKKPRGKWWSRAGEKNRRGWGRREQQLCVWTKTDGKVTCEEVASVLFVPLVKG